VDYAHRTTAEFLAASWLARQVRAGLPLGRVQALIGIDGRPSAELRGLHAWLTVMLPEHAPVLIDADPYGVITYGDAGSLTPSARHQLLDSLAHLSDTDPWFRAGNWSSPALGALAQPDVVERFRAILQSADSPSGFRTEIITRLQPMRR